MLQISLGLQFFWSNSKWKELVANDENTLVTIFPCIPEMLLMQNKVVSLLIFLFTYTKDWVGGNQDVKYILDIQELT